MILPSISEPIQLARELQQKIDAQRKTAEQRTSFEQAVFQWIAYVTEQNIKPPLLLDDEKTASMPPLLHGRVYADFRDEYVYFTTAFDLILSLYQLLPDNQAAFDLRESLRSPVMV